MGSSVASYLYDSFKHWYRGNGGNVWFYSDPHFGDIDLLVARLGLIELKTIAGHREQRFMDPNDSQKIYNVRDLNEMVKKFDEQQVKNINSCVGKNGTIIILGDIGTDTSWIPKIKGYKVLVRGNHDHGVEQYRRVRNVTTKFSSDDISPIDKKRMEIAKQTGDFIIASIVSKAIIDRYSYDEIDDNNLFDEVYKGCLMISDKIILSHVPVDFEYAFNIHGHIHDVNHKGDDKHLNVCAEVVNYMPVSLTAIVRDLKLIANIEDVNQAATDIATARKYGLSDK